MNRNQYLKIQSLGATVDGVGKIISKATGKVSEFRLTEPQVNMSIIDRCLRDCFGLGWLSAKAWLQRGAVTHNATLRNTLADAVVDATDVSAPGILRIETTAAALLATITFSATAFGAASGGTATANAMTDETNASAGTAAQFEVRDGAATSVFLGNVQTSGGDINLSSLSIGAGDTVSISSLTYSAPA